ncbi:MAG: hypothetical protein Q9184_005973 [Pyrenodesmia sp. 2 TL-2023]
MTLTCVKAAWLTLTAETKKASPKPTHPTTTSKALTPKVTNAPNKPKPKAAGVPNDGGPVSQLQEKPANKPCDESERSVEEGFLHKSVDASCVVCQNACEGITWGRPHGVHQYNGATDESCYKMTIVMPIWTYHSQANTEGRTR